jgi:hypothetical protein
LIHLFIAFHVLAMGLAALPRADRQWERLGLPWVPTVHQAIAEPLRPYLSFAGMTQKWNMFARPPDRCVHLEAIVRFADGGRATWQAPSVHLAGLFARHGKKRHRKWEEMVLSARGEPLWPDAARHVARQFRGRTSSPVAVDLVRRWAAIEVPAGFYNWSFSERLPDRYTSLDHSSSEVFFRYAVQPKDLR